MRLSGLDGPPGADPGGTGGARAASFGAALREAEARRDATGLDGRRGDGEAAARRSREVAARGERATAARREREVVSRREQGGVARRELELGRAQARRASPVELRASALRRQGCGPEAASAATGHAGPAGAPGAGGALPLAQPQPGAPPAGAVTLSLAARAVVPAAEAFRRSGQEALALDFGPALGVELRARAGGVELTLAAAPGLSAAARAELPALVRALAARGVTVVRSGVRPREAAEGRRR